MKYTITTLPVSDEKKAKLLARAIQSKAPGISFTELTELLQREEFKVGSGIPPAQAEQLQHQLDEIGVQYRLVKEIEQLEKPQPIQQETAPRVAAKPSHSPEPRLAPLTTITPKQLKRSPLTIPLTAVVLVLLIAFSILLKQSAENRREFTLNELRLTDTTASGAPRTEPVSGKMSSKEKKSQQLLDSADQTCFSGGTDTEQLYRFALSYNRKNKNAWFGLLNCMRYSNRETEAVAIEKEMIALFGEDVLNPALFGRDFGVVSESSVTGTTASLVLESSRLESYAYSDLFQIARRFSSTGKFSSLKVLVKRPDGSGLFLTASPIGCLSYSEFVQTCTFETFN